MRSPPMKADNSILNTVLRFGMNAETAGVNSWSDILTESNMSCIRVEGGHLSCRPKKGKTQRLAARKRCGPSQELSKGKPRVSVVSSA